MHRDRKFSQPNSKTPTAPDIIESVTLERVKLWIAITSLAAAITVGVFSVYQSHLQSKRLQTVTIAIRDAEDIRLALQKPLEGIWQYRLDFSRYFGQSSVYVATGTAIFLWDPAKQRYQAFIGYSISQEYKTEKIVTAFLEGALRADELGWPSEGFEISLKYLERTAVAEFASPPAASFVFTDGRYDKSTDGKRAVRLTAHYENPRSLGTVTFSR